MNPISWPRLPLTMAAAVVMGGAAWAGEFDLSGIPGYVPQQKVSGVIRNYGFGFGGVYKIWEEGFRKFQPDVSFDDKFPTSDAAFPALVTGVTDLPPHGGQPATPGGPPVFAGY